MTDPLDIIARPSAPEPEETTLSRLWREVGRQRTRIDLLEEAALAGSLTEEVRSKLAASDRKDSPETHRSAPGRGK